MNVQLGGHLHRVAALAQEGERGLAHPLAGVGVSDSNGARRRAAIFAVSPRPSSSSRSARRSSDLSSPLVGIAPDSGALWPTFANRQDSRRIETSRRSKRSHPFADRPIDFPTAARTGRVWHQHTAELFEIGAQRLSG